ncbi:hypothetical protein HL670_04315 [Serratia plymuthica]|uniref:Uncharacterized protein n=1 Tax=Serratia plymuthica TaxID=82996 RepID=A0A2X4TZP3_SERPL|nr:hypothetical protein HL670_04315 [Serratia plymuthica]RKS63720.1 hypothetical protein C8E17_3001 [Serratia plymuthica]CAI1922405.1 Uncharacterised protein [Serratia plymuthica]CAI2480207.1 Uncharacterised protein [Serratia plymuthica]SQI32391.1 Uncharacterised protein [Serratia plymuthica]
MMRAYIYRCWCSLSTQWLSLDWWFSGKGIWIGSVLLCIMFWGAALGLVMWIWQP